MKGSIGVPLTRVYVDTSVFGGLSDAEFAFLTRPMFEAIRRGDLVPLVSALVRDELALAPERVREAFRNVQTYVEPVEVSAAALALRDASLDAGVLTPKSSADATHVAIATIARADAIVSWNFRHIVNARLMPLYNAVNTLMGFGPIAIHAPPEVVSR